MLTIFKKELKSYFRTGSGFFFVAAFLLIAGVFSTVYNLSTGYSGIEIILPVLSRVLAVLLPIFTANLFASERGNGTDKLFLSLPFKSSHIVLGKYTAMLSLLGAETVFLALLPVVFGFFGTVNYLVAYISLVCFFLFGAAMLALYVFIASAAKSKLLATVISYSSAVVAFLLYLVPTGATENLWMTVAKTLRFISPFSHLDDFAVGAVRIHSILYFVVFTALFIFLAIRAEDKKRTKLAYGKGAPETKRGALSPVVAIVLSVCTVVLNASLSFLPVRLSTFDATSNKEISLSNSTKEFLSSLDCKVDIYVINADGTNKPFELFVELYDEHSDKLNVKYVYQDDMKEKLMSYGWDGSSALPSYTLLIESERGRALPFSPDDGYFYYHPSFGNMSESQYQQYYQTLTQYAAAYPDDYKEMLDSLVNDTEAYSNIEQQLTMSIEYTSLKFIPGAYYLTGHGESAPEASYLYNVLASSNIEFRGALDLSSVSSLPEDASSLIINAPTRDLSVEEAALIKNFLVAGGALTLITNEANLDMPNLMSILAHYGVSASSGAVIFDYKAAAEKAEQEKAEESENKSEQNEVTYPDNDFVYAQINTAHPSTSYLDSQTPAELKRANHIEVSTALRSSVKVTPLLTTDKDCFIEGVENSTGVKTVAVAIEETVGNVTTDIAWYTGAGSFGSQNLGTLAAAYSILYGIEDPALTLGEIEPIPIGENTLTVSQTILYAFIIIMVVIIPCSLIVAGTVAYKKLKRNPFAQKKEEKEEETPPSTEETEE